MEKLPFFRAATAGLGIYHTGGYGWIGVYRVNVRFDRLALKLLFKPILHYALGWGFGNLERSKT